MKGNLLTFLLILFFTLGCVVIKAQKVIVCQDNSIKSNYTNECECQDQSFYNAYLGKCQNICDYYGNNICDENNNAICSLIDENDPRSKNCSCMTGFDESGTADSNLCVDIDECSDDTKNSCNEAINEHCVNLFGSYECVCKTNYKRDENGECVELDECHLPNHPNECDQICKYSKEPYSNTCDCYDEFTLTNGICELSSGYETCECEYNPSVGICAKDKTTNNTSCYPKYGYEREDIDNTTYILKDFDECTNGSYQCYDGQHCNNKLGTFSCECEDGFELHRRLKRCVKKKCPKGSVIYNAECTELCGTEIGSNCPRETVCVVDDDNVPFCDCQLGCYFLGSESDETDWYLYSLQFTVLNDKIGETGAHALYYITRAIDTIFGRGRTQIMNIFLDTGKVEMAVGLSEKYGITEELKESIERQCYHLYSFEYEEKCILPNGLIIDKNSIETEVIYPCSAFESLCNHSNTKCVDKKSDSTFPSGGYECRCDDGYVKAPDVNEYYCIAADCINTDGSLDCGTSSNTTYDDLQKELEQTQKDLDDAEHKTKVVGGVLGALFGVCVILLIGAAVYIASHHKS
ncbi:UNVERIFIED_CONTAM: hypothetical protein RMT77_010520 [Armadillidium vulgare]